MIKVLKEKKGKATVIEYNGDRYVLEHPTRSKLDKAITKKQKNKENGGHNQ